MLLTRILQHDMHKSHKSGIHVPWIELQGLNLPVLISGSRGNFLVARKHHPGQITRVGTFSYDSDRVDDHIDDMIRAAYELSKVEGWNNFFSGQGAAKKAFDYILDTDNIGQPHIGLFPDSWDDKHVDTVFGKTNLKDGKYRKYCRMYRAPVSFPAFFGRPDMVGLYTQFMGGTHSIVLHNIKMGISFLPDIH